MIGSCCMRWYRSDISWIRAEVQWYASEICWIRAEVQWYASEISWIRAEVQWYASEITIGKSYDSCMMPGWSEVNIDNVYSVSWFGRRGRNPAYPTLYVMRSQGGTRIYFGVPVKCETKQKRNGTKRIRSKRNVTNRNETKQIETKRNKTKRNKSKRNETKQTIWPANVDKNRYFLILEILFLY